MTKALARKGATVYVADIARQAPPELHGETNVHFVGDVDVSNRAACNAFIEAIPGRLDGLVNGAGICPPEGQLAPDALYQRVFAVNVTGTWNMGTEAIARMSQQTPKVTEGLLPGSKRDLPAGSIVNISSVGGVRVAAGGLSVYCASKHAVVGLTRGWAQDWHSLRVNSVAPGVTDTPLVTGAHLDNADRERLAKLAEHLTQQIPLGRIAYPTDIADAVLFLLSDASSYMTGQVLVVSGGAD